MSWICKRCETENPDTVDVCEVCDAQAPVLRNLKYELDLVYGNINLLGELAHWDSINVDGEWKKAGSKYRMYIKEDERLEIQIPIEELIQNKEENFNIVISYTNINTTRLLEKSLSLDLHSMLLSFCKGRIGDSFFEDCKELKQIMFRNGTRTIGSRACKNCSSLHDAIFPETVYKISSCAFCNTCLKSIYIPRSVEIIEPGAFSGKSKLKSIVVDADNPIYDSRNNCNAIIETATNKLVCGCAETVITDTVEIIGERAFCHCDELQSIVIPENVTIIEKSAFTYCTSLKQVIIPDSVKVIKNNAFSYCSQLTTVVLGKNVVSIERFAFCDCEALNEIIIKSSDIAIEPYAFSQCHSLEMIDIAEGVIKVEVSSDSFSLPIKGIKMSPSLNINISSSLTEISYDFFRRLNVRLQSIDVHTGNKVFASIDGVLYNHDHTELIKMPARNSMSAIEIPETVTNIRNGAFIGCELLKKIWIPENVVSIGENAFGGCSKLEYIDVASGNKMYASIDGILYNKDCSELIRMPEKYNTKDFEISKTVTTIKSRAFQHCHSLQYLHVPSSVRVIEEWAFFGCKSLARIDIQKGVSMIEANVFNLCEKLQEINVAQGNTSYTSIDGVLYNNDCSKIIKIPQGYSNKELKIPDTVTDISIWNLSGCMMIEEIMVSPSNPAYTSIDGILYDKACEILLMIPKGKVIEHLLIPNSVKKIGYNAITCKSIKSIRIPKGIREIDKYCISYVSKMGIESVLVPKGIAKECIDVIKEIQKREGFSIIEY